MLGTPPILSVQRVGRSFGGVQALRDMDLEVQDGESAALIGPNGSGKTTLVNVITRMVDAETGTVSVAGVDVTREKPHRIAARGVARTFQHVRLIPNLSLRENALVGAIHLELNRFGGATRAWLRGGSGSKATIAAADAALDMVEVPDVIRDALPREVSFAMQRHTEIARALASRPRLLLLDEPAAGMNPAEVKTLLRLLSTIRETLGAATLLIDHNVEFVMRAASRVTVINRGIQIASGPANVVRQDPAVIEAYLGTRRGSAGTRPL